VLFNSLFVLAMPGLSFRWLAGSFVPTVDRCKRAVVVGAVAALAACGAESGPQVVTGTGYSFQAPGDWHIARSAREVRVSEGGDSAALVGVSRFALLRAFRPAL